MTTSPSMSARDWIMMTFLSVIWGGSYLFNGIAVQELPPFTIVATRVGLAALTLQIGLRIAGIAMPRAPKIWLTFFSMGLLNNLIPFSLIVWAQGHIASGLASILIATTPLFAVVVAHLLTSDERMTGGRLAGTLTGFAGVALMIGPSAISSIGSDLIAEIVVLTAAFTYALAGIYGRRFRTMGIKPIVSATGQITASALMMIPLALIVDRPWTLAAPGLPTIAALIAIALFSTALAYIIFFRLLASAGATNLMLVTFLIPVSAILLGWLFLGERLQPQHLIGMATIVAGLLLIDGRLPRRLLRSLQRAPVSSEG